MSRGALSITSVLEAYGCRSPPATPRTLFTEDRISIEDVFAGVSPLASKPSLDRARVVPSDAVHALRRLRSGDYKQFLESYVETSLCPYVNERCRELGPRILYGLTRLEDGVEFYSECIDSHLLAILLFGDLVGLMRFYIGRRGLAKFTAFHVPREPLLNPDFLLELEYLELPGIERDFHSCRTLRSFLEALESCAEEISEIVVSVPCLTEGFVYEIAPRIAELVKKGARAIVVTRSMGDAEVICPSKSLSRYVLLHMELRTALRNCYICSWPHVESTIIVNRCVAASSFEPWLDMGSRIAVVKDSVYASTVANEVIRQCICSSPLA